MVSPTKEVNFQQRSRQSESNVADVPPISNGVFVFGGALWVFELATMGYPQTQHGDDLLTYGSFPWIFWWVNPNSWRLHRLLGWWNHVVRWFDISRWTYLMVPRRIEINPAAISKVSVFFYHCHSPNIPKLLLISLLLIIVPDPYCSSLSLLTDTKNKVTDDYCHFYDHW